MVQIDFVVNGRYRVLGTLGIGGMGTVYAAHDERLGRHVALKLLRPEIAQDQRARERFLREAQIAAQLLHPNIVRTYDVGEAPEGPFLVQELLDGRTLDTQLPLSPALTLVIALGVADALDAIHSQGYVHCDIKPQNIMLVGDINRPRVVLLDFGIARVAGTDTTTLIATPHYLAPERALGAAPTAAADLYALGIVLFHALTGQPPFDAPTIHAIIEQHRSAPLPPLKLATGGTPGETQGFEAIIRKLTAKEPQQRYSSAAALRGDLMQLATGSVHAQPTQVVAPQPQPQPATRQPSRLPEPPRAPHTPGRSHKTIALRYVVLPVLLAVLLLSTLLLRQSPDATEAAEPNLRPPMVSAAAVASAQPDVSMLTVPDVIGQPLATAQAQLQAAGLQSVVEATVVNEHSAGSVIVTIPAPNEPVAAGSIVHLQVSSGPPSAAAPPEEKQEDRSKQEDEGKKKGKENGKGKGSSKKDN